VAADPDRFPVRIGDWVGPGLPGRGAGLIEEPGARDVNELAARAGDRVLIQTAAVDGDRRCATESALRLTVRDPAGLPVGLTAGNLTSLQGCGWHSYELATTGVYTVEVVADQSGVDRGLPGVGSYALRLWPAPRQVIPVALGDRIEPGVPAPGAGEFASPGEEDVYEFEAEAGASIVVDFLSFDGDPDCAGSALRWDLYGPAGQDLDGPGLSHGLAVPDCGEALVPIPETGQYRLVVYGYPYDLSRGLRGTGGYQLELALATPDR
jgi:hypothetical protein